MRPERLLTLEIMRHFAQHFPHDFSLVDQIETSKFEKKELVDETYLQSREYYMLPLGPYHTQKSQDNTYVYATTSGVHFALSLPGQRLAKPVPTEHAARVYVKVAPFSEMIGGNDTEVPYTNNHAKHGFRPGITQWRGIIEAVTYFIYFKKNLLEYAQVENVQTVLENFRKACRFFAMRQARRPGHGGLPTRTRPPTSSSLAGSSGGWGGGSLLSGYRDDNQQPLPTTEIKTEVKTEDNDLDGYDDYIKTEPDNGMSGHSLLGGLRASYDRRSPSHTRSSISSDVSSLLNTSRASSMLRSAFSPDSITSTDSNESGKALRARYRGEMSQALETSRCIRERERQRNKSTSAESRITKPSRKTDLRRDVLRNATRRSTLTTINESRVVDLTGD
ncbi:hypothetical protein NX059_000707 [Plenodomus lindquistii]|nr:hypothetical protein NX059_000707 [Plenodomus lindquistii]